MALLALAPDNKNQFRKYPLKQASTCAAEDGYVIGDSLIVNCSITSTYGQHRIYVRQIAYKDSFVRITIASVLDGVTLGCFSGNITDNFTTLELTPFKRFVDGFLTIGSLDELKKITKVLHFDSAATEIEESTIFCYKVPNVTSLEDKRGSTARGQVGFGSLININETKNVVSNSLDLSVINASVIFNLADRSSRLDNCPTPIIKTINGVSPYPIGEGSDINDGNIYLIGVNPIVFYGRGHTTPDYYKAPGTIKIETPSLTLDQLCAARNKILPPTDNSFLKNSWLPDPSPFPDEVINNQYYTKSQKEAGNFNTAELPEYYIWPQFTE